MKRSLLLALLMVLACGASHAAPFPGQAASLAPVHEERVSWDDLGMGFLLHTSSEGYVAPLPAQASRTTTATPQGAAGTAAHSNPLRRYLTRCRSALPHRPCNGYIYLIACLRL